jgi:5-methyltetrahydrofolate--homocysteine methyltransferase
VHVLVTPAPGHSLESILHSWKRHSALQANKLLGKSGAFWQKESYDHIIRDETDWMNQLHYLLGNPAKAGLHDWKWVGSISGGGFQPPMHGGNGGFQPPMHGGNGGFQPPSHRLETDATLLTTLREFIDWSPFFHSWEMRGRWIAEEKRFSSAHEDAEMKAKAEVEALKLYNDANALLDRIIAEKRFTAKGVFGIFPANSVGDDIEVYENGRLKTTLHTLRQQVIKKDKPNFALSDYIAPKDSGRTDHIGCFCAGIHGGDEFAKEFEAAQDPYHAILTKAVADRLAEAFAEYLHQQARFAWGYEKPGDFANADLIKENYRGIRPAPGYPAQPDHTEKPTLFALLDATAKTGVELTESMVMHPGAAVSGLYFAHPEAHYFGISVLGKDQVEDYAKRKGMTVAEAEKWLGPWLGY